MLIRVEQDGDYMNLEGWEDLNNSKQIEDASDDRLFSIARNHNREHEMRGYGANGYYRSHFGVGDFLFTYMLSECVLPGIWRILLRHTFINRYDTISRDRTNYRNSANYRSQVSRNSNYFSKQKTFAGSSYDQASRNVSASRQTYSEQPEDKRDHTSPVPPECAQAGAAQLPWQLIRTHIRQQRLHRRRRLDASMTGFTRGRVCARWRRTGSG